MKYHYIEQSLIAPVHKVTVGLIGVGGTGSYVLSILARMNAGLIGLGHPGFFVTSYDGDVVTESNIGRQLFSKSDLGFNKSDLTMERINRFYGTNWDSINQNFRINYDEPKLPFNIIITCVDNIETRKDIQFAKTKQQKTGVPYEKCWYWLDFGNGKNFGQAILGTMNEIEQPENGINILPTVMEEFDNKEMIKDKDEPSCSVLESLNRQDLLVNTTLSEFGMNLIWKLFRNFKTSQRGVFVNLNSMSVNPITI